MTSGHFDDLVEAADADHHLLERRRDGLVFLAYNIRFSALGLRCDERRQRGQALVRLKLADRRPSLVGDLRGDVVEEQRLGVLREREQAVL